VYRLPADEEESVVMTTANGEQRFEELFAEFDGMPGLRRGKAFGLPVIKIEGKIAVAYHEGQLVLKLPPERIAALIEEERGTPFSAYGKTMGGWIALAPVADGDWLALTEEAIAFVRPV
jgi:hypothetical protein